MTVKTTGGYKSTINGKNESPKQNIQKYGVGPTNQVRPWWKIMMLVLSIQCLAGSPSHQSSYWYCAHHTMVQRKTLNKLLVNDHMGVQSLFCQLKIWKEIPWHHNVHRSPHCFLYSDYWQYYSSGLWLFYGLLKTKNSLIYYDPHTNLVNRNHNAYIDEHVILIHPNERLTPGSILIHEYPNIQYTPAYNAQ